MRTLRAGWRRAPAALLAPPRRAGRGQVGTEERCRRSNRGTSGDPATKGRAPARDHGRRGAHDTEVAAAGALTRGIPRLERAWARLGSGRCLYDSTIWRGRSRACATPRSGSSWSCRPSRPLRQAAHCIFESADGVRIGITRTSKTPSLEGAAGPNHPTASPCHDRRKRTRIVGRSPTGA
jgi:hypothetical protein